MIELIFGKTVKQSFSAQNRKCLYLIFLKGRPFFPFNVQCANGERNGDALALQLVPDITAHRVVGLVDPGVIAHVEFDLVRHGIIGEVDQEHPNRGIGQDVFGPLRGTSERIFHPIWRYTVIDAYPDPHGVDFSRIVQINDLVAHHLVVGDIEINVVVRAKPGGTPVDLTHFAVGVAHLQPITDLKWPINLDRYAADDSGEQILPGETDNDCDHPGSRQQSFQLCFGVVAVTENKEQDDQEDDSADYLTQKMRNGCLSFLFEIKIPNLPINESDDQSSAQQDCRCTNMKAPWCMNSVNGNRGVKGED